MCAGYLRDLTAGDQMQMEERVLCMQLLLIELLLGLVRDIEVLRQDRADQRVRHRRAF